jgi:GT2 family glycosyltransferase
LPRVSAIVPIFNGVAFLPAFIESLSAALPAGSQLILVDDASTEPVWDTVPEMPGVESIVRLVNDSNVGYSAAVNRGFGVATGDIVVQLNTDLILEPDCVTAMVDLIDREERVGIVGSKLVYPTNGLVEHVGLSFGSLTKHRIFWQLPAAHPLCSRTRELRIVSGATVAMTRRVLDRLGPLEEQYFNQNEDLEHCLLAAKQGLRNFACAESVAHHWRSHSGPARFARIAASDSLFWSRWGSECEPDLGRFVDEGLDHVLAEAPQLAERPFQLLDLSRGVDQPIVLDRLRLRWPDIEADVRNFRQMNNPSDRLWLPLLLPQWVRAEPTPFVYLVDAYRELEENALWFEGRRRVVEDELVVDLNGVAARPSDLWPRK